MKNKTLIILFIVVALISFSISVLAVDSSIVTYYTFNETSGNPINSISGIANCSVSGNNNNFANGYIQYSRNQTGTSSSNFVACPINLNFENITVSFWFKPENNSCADGCSILGEQGKLKVIYHSAQPNKIVFVVQDSSTHYIYYVSNASVNVNQWNFIVVEKSKTYIETIINNVTGGFDWLNDGVFPNGNIIGFNPNVGGVKDSSDPTIGGLIDELMISNKIFSSSELQNLYYEYTQNRTPLYTTPPLIPTYNITLSSNPDINTSVFRINVTASVEATNTNLTNDTMKISYTAYTSLSSCAIWYQNLCFQNVSILSNRTMNKVNNTFFTINFSDTEIFPAYYPYNYSFIDNTQHLNDTVYQQNNLLFNVTQFNPYASQYIITLEFDAISKLANSSNMLIYYCNSSYMKNDNPQSSSNCILVDSFNPTTVYNHAHNQSRHQLIPVSFSGITKTKQSYIAFISTATNTATGWNFGYVTNSNYDNSSFLSCSISFNCVATNKIYDIHIHSFLSSDYFKMFATLNDSGTLTQSNTIYDYYNLTAFPPSAPDIISPICNQQFTLSKNNITTIINWTTSESINNLSILYNVTLSNGYFIVGNYPNTSYNWTLNSNILGSGDYFINVYAIDSLGFYDVGVSQCSFNICYNSWERTLQPCSNYVKLINYTDANNCNVAYDIPSDNGLYEECSIPSNPDLVNIYNAIYFIGVAIFIVAILIFFYKRNNE